VNEAPAIAKEDNVPQTSTYEPLSIPIYGEEIKPEAAEDQP